MKSTFKKVLTINLVQININRNIWMRVTKSQKSAEALIIQSSLPVGRENSTVHVRQIPLLHQN